MKAVYLYRRRPTKRECGFTLLELIIATAILVVLSTMAVPFARLTITREKGRTLRKDFETLVKGVDVQGKKIRFLRRIPIDPMTGTTEWGLRSMQDDPDSASWGGQSVFDVYTKSQGSALDGTKYKDW
jgi:general secretion pathway protein G